MTDISTSAKRISDIISANLNDLVEEYEDAEQMLRQAIREMEEAIRKIRQRPAPAVVPPALAERRGPGSQTARP